MRITKLFITFLVVIGTLDLTFTLIALRGGWLVEQNPIANYILSAWGGWGLAAFKIITTFVACTAIWVAVKKGWSKHRYLLTGGAVAAVVIYSLLLAHWARCFSQFL